MKLFGNSIIEIIGFLFYKKLDPAHLSRLILGLGELNNFMNVAFYRNDGYLGTSRMHNHGQSIPGTDGVQSDTVHLCTGFECE